MTDFSVRDMVRDYKSPEQVTTAIMIRKFARLGLNQFTTDVEGIPDGRIEWFLWNRRHALVWKHPMLGWVVTDFSVTGWDINGFPNKFSPKFETNIENLSLPRDLTEDDDCVVFWDTADPKFGRVDAMVWVGDIADVTETMRTQVFNQKTPMLAVVGNPKLKQKIQSMFIKIANNAKMLFIDKDMKDSIESFDINPTFNLTELWQYRKALENDVLEFMGIDSQDAFQKKERLIVDEQEGNDELLNYLLADCLKARQIAVKKCEEKGLTASTKIQEVVRPIDVDRPMDENEHSANDEQDGSEGFRET